MFVLDLFYQCDTLVKQYLHAYSTTYSVLLIKCYISKLLFTLKSVKKKKKAVTLYLNLHKTFPLYQSKTDHSGHCSSQSQTLMQATCAQISENSWLFFFFFCQCEIPLFCCEANVSCTVIDFGSF